MAAMLSRAWRMVRRLPGASRERYTAAGWRSAGSVSTSRRTSAGPRVGGREVHSHNRYRGFRGGFRLLIGSSHCETKPRQTVAMTTGRRDGLCPSSLEAHQVRQRAPQAMDQGGLVAGQDREPRRSRWRRPSPTAEVASRVSSLSPQDGRRPRAYRATSTRASRLSLHTRPTISSTSSSIPASGRRAR